jgi:hypothetical protein
MAALAVCAIAAALTAGRARAAEVKVLGHLDVPRGAQVMAVCTDPVVQSILNDDLRLSRNPAATRTVTVTVTVTSRVLSEGVSLADVSPGDPSVAEMLRELGAKPPPVGNAGNESPDVYAELARRQATAPEDPLTQQFRQYQAMRQNFSAGQTSPYSNIPKSEIYDTAVIARATLDTGPAELKVVELVHPGDDVHQAKELVAEEIANAILH